MPRNLFYVRLRSYGSSLAVIWSAIAIYRHGPYYPQFLSADAQTTLVILAIVYSVGGLIFYALAPADRLPVNKAYLLLRMLYRILRNCTLGPDRPWSISRQEKIAGLFLLVKFFFLPIMVTSLFGNYQLVAEYTEGISTAVWPLSLAGFNTVIFPILFYIFFFIDTLIFTVGYSTESNFMKNKVRSVDATTSGWLLCLICYPPFNSVLTNYLYWYANETNSFRSALLNTVIHSLVILLLAVYVSASLALGTRASNLTNRGIVASGPYSLLRHPAYSAKVLSWWLMMLPVISLAAVFSMAVWTAIYYGRAVTEERHLSKDADYRAYRQQVPSRFIPKLARFMPPGA